MTGDAPATRGNLARLFTRNTAANLVLRVVSAVASLVATAALIHGYGQERFALVALGLQLTGLSVLATPGLATALAREVAAAAGRGDLASASRITHAAAWLYLAASSLLAGAWAAFVLAGGLGVFRFSASTREAGTPVLLAAALVLLARGALAAWGDALAGLQEYPLLAVVRSTTALAIALAVTSIAWSGMPLALVLLAHAGGRLVEGLVLRAAARRRLPPAKVPPSRALAVLRPAARIGGEIALLDLASVVHYRVDTLVLALLRSAAAVTGYQVTVRLHNLLKELQGTLSSALAPLVAHEEGAGNRTTAQLAVYRGTRYNLVVLLPVVLPAVLYAGDFLRLWLGPGWDRWGPLAAIFAGYWGVAGAVAFTGQAAIGTGNVRPLALIAAGTALVNLGLSLYLAPRHGVAGVLAATLVADGIAIPLQAWTLFPRLGIRGWRFAREVLLPVYPATLACGGIALAARRLLPPPATFPQLVGRGALAGGLLLAVLAVTAVEARDRRRLFGALTGRR